MARATVKEHEAAVPTHVRDIPAIGRLETWRLATTELERVSDLLRSLTSSDWSLSTDCERWDVRALTLHLLGTAEAQASPRELVHQFSKGLPLNRHIESHHWVDGINELQIRDRNQMSGEEAVARFTKITARVVRGRRRVPPPFRWLPIPMGPPIGWKPLTYLLRMGFTRDFWMHRVDLARATGRTLVVTPEHDGRIVAGIVAEWARRHREPFTLVLEGPAGNTFVQGRGGEGLRMDAVEFCRILSGRGTGTGLLRHKLPL